LATASVAAGAQGRAHGVRVSRQVAAPAAAAPSVTPVDPAKAERQLEDREDGGFAR
jgi:hypothetical protein